jgi:hypothetical protein
VFIDHLTAEMCADSSGTYSHAARNRAIRWLTDVMRGAELDGSFALLLDDGSQTVGLSRSEMLNRVARSPLLLNVMGFISDEEILARAPRRVFLDIDPGFGQMWKALGLADSFAGHDDFVTVAEGIDDPECTIPTCGLDWLTTPQPIVLDYWPSTIGGTAFTSIGSWRGPYAPVDYDGRTYGLRAHEFRKFAELPGLSGGRFELALDIDDADRADLHLLERNSWKLVAPRRVAGDPARYRRYIQHSGAELAVAKGMYVETRGGWFSDRSICYLASGKPVLAQDTGFAGHHPVGNGLLAFTDLDDAVAGVDEIRSNYPRHAAAARELAEEEFEASKVLTRLLDRLGVG